MTEDGSGPDADALGRILVVIPTYDERENLPIIVRRLHASVAKADILVVDDGSPDGTGELADAMAIEDERIHVLHRTSKAGLGAAYLAGFAWALDRTYDVIVEMDADGSHDPEQLPRLLEALVDADLVLGSRWVKGGRVHDWPVSRQILSRGGNLYTRVALGIPLHDATGGYRAFRADALRRLALDQVDSQGYCFQVDLAWRAVRDDLRVREVPIDFVEREYGTSKMSQAIVAEALWRVTVWGAQDRARRVRSVARGALGRVRGRSSDTAKTVPGASAGSGVADVGADAGSEAGVDVGASAPVER